jgi:hypothetical protein
MLLKLKPCAAILLICLMVGVGTASAADGYSAQRYHDEYTAARMAADLIVARPLGLAATVLGSALFIVSLPFSLLGSNTDEVYQRLVADTARYTFRRKHGGILKIT